MKVVLIGSGNVATVLGKKIQNAGHQILQVVGRSIGSVQRLSSTLNSSWSLDLLNISAEADLYIIAVPDESVLQVAEKIYLPGKCIVHTAGSLSANILQNSTTNFGVLYPLQSLRKEMPNVPAIPVLIDGNSDEIVYMLEEFCKNWAESIWRCNDQERLKLHLGAVIASNFTNHFYTIAENYLKDQGLNFNLLLPLIKETAQRIGSFSPAGLQTGPAIRGDSATIEKHLFLLDKYPAYKSLYNTVTESIIQYHQVSAQ